MSIENPNQGLIIDIARLASEGERINGEIPEEAFDSVAEAMLFKPLSGIKYSLFVQILGSELLVRGKVSMDFQCLCVRCGEEFPFTASDQEVTFSMEITPDSFVNLTDELRESIILSLPINPICKEDCKGLCTKCGANLNKTTCTCTSEDDFRKPGLEALDSLNFDALNMPQGSVTE